MIGLSAVRPFPQAEDYLKVMEDILQEKLTQNG